LLFRVSDNSGRASIRVRIFRGPRQIGSVTGRGPAANDVYYVRWRAPKRGGLLTFCASAWDARGNTSARSCARLRVR
jgi:hypothetical protein